MTMLFTGYDTAILSALHRYTNPNEFWHSYVRGKAQQIALLQQESNDCDTRLKEEQIRTKAIGDSKKDRTIRSIEHEMLNLQTKINHLLIEILMEAASRQDDQSEQAFDAKKNQLLASFDSLVSPDSDIEPILNYIHTRLYKIIEQVSITSEKNLQKATKMIRHYQDAVPTLRQIDHAKRFYEQICANDYSLPLPGWNELLDQVKNQQYELYVSKNQNQDNIPDETK